MVATKLGPVLDAKLEEEKRLPVLILNNFELRHLAGRDIAVLKLQSKLRSSVCLDKGHKRVQIDPKEQVLKEFSVLISAAPKHHARKRRKRGRHAPGNS